MKIQVKFTDFVPRMQPRFGVFLELGQFFWLFLLNVGVDTFALWEQ